MRKIKNIVSTLFLAEAHYDIDLLSKELLEIFDREEDKTAISLLINWFAQLRRHRRIPEKDYDKLERIYTNKQEAKEMLITAIKKEQQAFFDKGERKGKRHERIQIAHKLLAKGFETALIAEISGLPDKEIMKLKKGIRTAQ